MHRAHVASKLCSLTFDSQGPPLLVACSSLLHLFPSTSSYLASVFLPSSPQAMTVLTSTMEQELNQVAQAIVIASDPLQGALHQQALQYLSTVQQNSANTWRLALAIFVDVGPNGARKYSPQARFFALRVLDDFLDNRCVLLNILVCHIFGGPHLMFASDSKV